MGILARSSMGGRDDTALKVLSGMKKLGLRHVGASGTAHQFVALLVFILWCTMTYFACRSRLDVKQPAYLGQEQKHRRRHTSHLLFYNKPPKTGSTTVRVAMENAAREAGLTASHCFKTTKWSEMAVRTVINRDSVDFYGCHTRLFRERFVDIVNMRGGNVTFMTSTRDAKHIILSSFLQRNRDRKIADIIDPEEIEQHVEMYKDFVEKYPVNALYKFHGGMVPLKSCPYTYKHEYEMRRLAERYEIVVDLERPQESAAIVEAITGLKPNFNIAYNVRGRKSSPMITALSKVDTTHKECGNELVHMVLKEQYNIVKDRLMRKPCFNEELGAYDACDETTLRKENLKGTLRLT